jgi:hypothetical protein
MNSDEHFSIYMALDGPHLDGLIGSAGIIRFDWPEQKYYIRHYLPPQICPGVLFRCALFINLSKFLIPLRKRGCGEGHDDVATMKSQKIDIRKSHDCIPHIAPSPCHSPECRSPGRSRPPSSLLFLSSRISLQTGQDNSCETPRNCFQ